MGSEDDMSKGTRVFAVVVDWGCHECAGLSTVAITKTEAGAVAFVEIYLKKKGWKNERKDARNWTGSIPIEIEELELLE